MAELEDSIYDDEAAVNFIKNQLPVEAKDKFTDDEIVYITDVIVDYYSSNGLLDSDADEEVEIDVEDLVSYVVKQSKRDKFEFDHELVRWVVEGELDYEESLQ